MRSMINESFEFQQVNEVTTADLLDLCGAWDSQAVYASFFGLFLCLFMMFYFLRFRKLLDEKVNLQHLLDKFFFTLQGFTWVFVIVRLMRAG